MCPTGAAERHEGHAGAHHRLHGSGQLQVAAIPERPVLQRGHQVDGDPQFDYTAEAELLRVCHELLVKDSCAVSRVFANESFRITFGILVWMYFSGILVWIHFSLLLIATFSNSF